jgi:hypothetical protein
MTIEELKIELFRLMDESPACLEMDSSMKEIFKSFYGNANAQQLESAIASIKNRGERCEQINEQLADSNDELKKLNVEANFLIGKCKYLIAGINAAEENEEKEKAGEDLMNSI